MQDWINNAIKKKKRIYLETSADFTSFTKKKKRRNIDDKYLITPTSYKSLTVMISQYIYTEEVYLLRETGCWNKVKIFA